MIFRILNSLLGRIFLLYPTVLIGGAGFNLAISIFLSFIFPYSGQIFEIAVWFIAALVSSQFNRHIAQKHYKESTSSWGWIGVFWSGAGVMALIFSITLKNKAPENMKESIIARHHKVAHVATIIGVIFTIIRLIFFIFYLR